MVVHIGENMSQHIKIKFARVRNSVYLAQIKQCIRDKGGGIELLILLHSELMHCSCIAVAPVTNGITLTVWVLSLFHAVQRS